LTTLDIKGNIIGNIEANTLAVALENNRTLTKT
jgi:hypothetical protein